jgi:hypothetical protein
MPVMTPVMSDEDSDTERDYVTTEDAYWERRLSSSGKINFPPPVREPTFLIIEPGATDSFPRDEIHLYPESESISIENEIRGEIHRGKMRDGQINIPRDFREKSDLSNQKVDVEVHEGDDGQYILRNPTIVEE